MKAALLLFASAFLTILTSCEALEKTDMIRSEPIMQVQDQTLIYEMYLTGTDKYRYAYKLVNAQDTTQLFEAKITDETANNLGMEIEKTGNGYKIILDKPIEKQQKTVDGVTYQLEGTK
ncbi:MAG TPA: hypothetical protein VK927_07265 [Adhaeribacter sp.]|nr:hypothetical protein [Adhaeribacter sp.]